MMIGAAAKLMRESVMLAGLRVHQCDACFVSRIAACNEKLPVYSYSHNAIQSVRYYRHLSTERKWLSLAARCPVLPSQQTVRLYRVKHDRSVLTTEQLFIKRILQTTGRKFSDTEIMRGFTEKMTLLTNAGCRPYELGDFPRILLYELYEIAEFINRFKLLNQTKVSVNLLRFVVDDNWRLTAEGDIRKFVEENGGRQSYIEELMRALQCSEEEMLEIMIRNPRLVGPKNRKCFLDKLNLLLENGAQLQDIKANTHLLCNVSHELIKSRAKILVGLGCNKPLHIGLIGRTNKHYNELVARLSVKSESLEVIRSLPPECSKFRLYTLKPKVDLLLSYGYTDKDILSHLGILSVSMSRLRESISFLQQHCSESVDLGVCLRHAKNMHIATAARRPSLRKKLASFLLCEADHLPVLPMKDRCLPVGKKQTLADNMQFLSEKGFAVKDIRKIPVILSHDCNVLRQNWELLQEDRSYDLWRKKWKKDAMKRLNLLQYYIEKSISFSHVAVAEQCSDETTPSSSGLCVQEEDSEVDGLDRQKAIGQHAKAVDSSNSDVLYDINLTALNLSETEQKEKAGCVESESRETVTSVGSVLCRV